MKKYITLIKVSFSQFFIERESILVWSVSSFLSLIVIISVWRASGRETIAGFNQNQLITYYIIMYFWEQLIGYYVFWGIREKIMDGTIANFILKPINFSIYTFCTEFAYKFINLLTHVVVGSIIFLAFSQFLSLKVNFITIIQLLPFLIIGTSIIFLINFILGCITFFVIESNFLNDFNWMMVTIFSGKLIPIAFFPGVIKNIINVNPYRYTFAPAGEILLGKISNNDYISLINGGLFWIIILSIIAFIIWKIGLKKYSSFGQ